MSWAINKLIWVDRPALIKYQTKIEVKMIQIKRPSPAMALAAVALFVALGGTGYATASGGVASKKPSIHIRHKDKVRVKIVIGPTGPRGPQGIPGPPGPPGATGQQGQVGTARAYAYVVPHRAHCGGCGEQAAGTETAPVIDPTRSLNVTLGTAGSHASSGVWCFSLGAGIDPSTATVVVSPIPGPFVQVAAIWIPGAGGCLSENEIEVETVGYEVKGGEIVAVPNNEIAFSFVVP